MALVGPLKLCPVTHGRNILSLCLPGRALLSIERSMASNKLRMADRLTGTDQNVWVEFGKLATDYKAINLGQGFPDFMPPEYIKKNLVEAVMSDNVFANQYCRSFGHPRLVAALSKLFSPIMGRDIDAASEILISVGAYGSLFSCVQGLINPGDEVIIIEPYFDCYEPMVKVAGGIPVFVPLRPPQNHTGHTQSSADWKWDSKELASKFNSKTKAVFFNTPNNPLGKMYSREEMEELASLCITHDTVVFADEVYEWMVYEPNTHIKIATLPGMWDRTITIGSAGKTFSVTGWKIGWSIGPKHLLHSLQTMHQNCLYTCPTPIQDAIAKGFEYELTQLDSPECYFNSFPAELRTKRDRMAKVLEKMGMVPVIPQGGYFMICDFSKIEFQEAEEEGSHRDFKFVKWMTKNKGLSAIPPTAFYSAGNKYMAENLVRFCFCKEDATLDKAMDILQNW